MFGLGPWELILILIILTIVVGLPVLFVAFVFSLFFRRRGRERDRTQWNEETRLMQEMHDNLSKMETRIEALETILMERFGKDNR
jgi:phage shock protein B